MRIVITKEATNLAALVASLARDKHATSAILERVKALNPQIADMPRLGAGTVLILPESAELKPGAGEPAGGESLAALGALLHTGLRDVDSRMTRGSEALAAEHAAVRDALKTAAARRLIESDPQLKKQLAAAEARFKADQKRATETQEQLDEGKKFALAELEKLQILLGQ
jgi:Phage Tail Protein X